MNNDNPSPDFSSSDFWSKGKNFYVYLYLRSSDDSYGPVGTPYYVGKGRHHRRFDLRHNVLVPTDPSNNVIMASGLTERDALQAEMLLIAVYGRISSGGLLENLSRGGSVTKSNVRSNSGIRRAGLSRAASASQRHFIAMRKKARASAHSLFPTVKLTYKCALGDPTAKRIQDFWKFRAPTTEMSSQRLAQLEELSWGIPW